MDGPDVIARLTLLERQVEDLRRELEQLSTLVAGGVDADRQPADEGVAVTVSPAAEPVPAAGREPTDADLTSLRRAWRALERGDSTRALDEAFRALRSARATADADALAAVVAFAEAAAEFADAGGRRRAEFLAADAGAARRPTAASAQRARPQVAAAAAAAPAAPAAPAGPTLPQRALDWVRAELTGARAFAVAGGTVTLLGIVFLFVLAANRGWVGPTERVGLGAVLSLALVGAGLALHARYGHVQAAFATVGAGLAGAYATLASATILYEFLPQWSALIVAAGIAATGGWIAVRWSSQILAGLALVGAGAAPGLVSLGGAIEWPGTAFALVVLAAAIAVASPRRWLWLEWALAVVALAQVAWLAGAEASANDPAAVAVTSAAALLLLAGAVAWQAYGEPVLDEQAATLSLVGAAVGLMSPIVLLSGSTDAGIVLLGLALVFAAAALAVARRWRDLGWTIGAEALLLGGVAAAFLLSGRSLTVVWAFEAAVLTALAWKLRTPRFAAAGLAYLAAGLVHSTAFEIAPAWPESSFDVPGTAAPGLFALAAASLATGLLLPAGRRDQPSTGVAAALEPVWETLVGARVQLRAALALGAAALLAGATAAVLSGRWLTLLWAVLAAALGAAAAAFGERRLHVFALGFLAAAAAHALGVEAPPRALALERDGDAARPIASLVALAAAAAILALVRFEQRGISRLGPLAGPERRLEVLGRRRRGLRATLAASAGAAATWALGLGAVAIEFEPGQVLATALWGTLSAVVIAVGARAKVVPLQWSGAAIALFAFAKSCLFDWSELGDAAAATSLLAAASALLVGGFLTRWLDPSEASGTEIPALGAAAVAAVAAIVALERVLDFGSRGLGAASLAVVAALATAAAPPYIRRRSGGESAWLRTLATGYGALALAALLFAESRLVLGATDETLALWGLTAGVLALAWKPLREERVWLAAGALAVTAAAGSLAFVTTPSRLVQSSAHPGTGLWVLSAAAAAAWAVALAAPTIGERLKRWLVGAAAGLTLYGVSLGVLELAERVSGGSVQTDFQRGHTALSALWGASALVAYAVGLRRDSRNARTAGLALFGLALAKLFLYDLSTLSTETRALSFLAVGVVLMAAGFFAERLVRARDDDPAPDVPASST